MVSTTKGINLMFNIFKDFLFKPKHSNGFLMFIMIFSMHVAFYLILYKTKDIVCFPKSQFTELEKSTKTNRLLRGTYNDL